MTTTEKVSTKVGKSVRSEDEKLDKQVPGASFVVVGLTYLLILLGVVAVIAAMIYLL